MSTQSQPKLPFDVLHSIVNILGTEDDRDARCVGAISQTCSTLLPLAQKYLFSTLKLKNKFDSSTFSNLVGQNPRLLSYVRKMVYFTHDPLTPHERQILELISTQSTQLPLRSVILSMNYTSWDNLPEYDKALLTSLLQLPTVSHVKLQHIKHFPFSILASCYNVVVLLMLETKLIPLEAIQSPVGRSLPKLKKLFCHHGSLDDTSTVGVLSSHGNPLDVLLSGRVVDLSHLRAVSFTIENARDVGAVRDVLQRTTHLQSIAIRACGRHLLRLAELGIGRIGRANPGLRRILISVSIYSGSSDPLCGLSAELRMMAGNSIVQELILIIKASRMYTSWASLETWSMLDSLLTESGAFPELNVVIIDITWCGVEGLGVLETLGKWNFPKLSDSKAVEFSFFQNANSPYYFNYSIS